MDEVLHANIFFFITGISVIIFTALLCVALFHAIKALRVLRKILTRIEEGAEVITEDMQSVRAYFAEEGLLPRLIMKLVGTGTGRAAKDAAARKQEKKK